MKPAVWWNQFRTWSHMKCSDNNCILAVNQATFIVKLVDHLLNNRKNVIEIERERTPQLGFPHLIQNNRHSHYPRGLHHPSEYHPGQFEKDSVGKILKNVINIKKWHFQAIIRSKLKEGPNLASPQIWGPSASYEISPWPVLKNLLGKIWKNGIERPENWKNIA